MLTTSPCGAFTSATRGHQAITWSPRLREVLAAPERSDEDLAAEEVGGEIIVMIPAQTWRAVVQVPGLPAYLLDEAERGGADAVAVALQRFGAVKPDG